MRGVNNFAARESTEQPRKLCGRADRQLRCIVGSALIAHQIKQGGAAEAQRFRAFAHGIEPDPAEQEIGCHVVARRTDECCEVGDGQRGSLHVLPHSAVSHEVARSFIEDAVPREIARR